MRCTQKLLIAAFSLLLLSWIRNTFTDPFRCSWTVSQHVGAQTLKAIKSTTAFPALDCPSFLTLMRNNSHPQQVVDPNQGTMHVGQTFALPYPFYWSVHNKEYHPIRWGSFLEGRWFEHVQDEAWIRILEHENQLRRQQSTAHENNALNHKSIVLDVGSNIGYYTLLSARMGYTVHAFEPNNINLLRLCESVLLNAWNSISIDHSNVRDGDYKDSLLVNIHALGVSDKTDTLPFYSGVVGPGQGSFQKSGDTTQTPSFYVNVTSLDMFALDQGWLDTDNTHSRNSVVRRDNNLMDNNDSYNQIKVSIPILKVDVEGLEAAVILGAARLLHQRIIKNIFIEVWLSPGIRPALQLLQDAGYELYKYGSWSGPDHVNTYGNGKKLLDLLYSKTSLFNPSNHEYINMWWKLPEAANL